MRCKIIGSYVAEKYALVNFGIGSFSGCGFAFPIKFTDSGLVRLPHDEFAKLLEVGSDVDISYSKKLNRYLVKF